MSNAIEKEALNNLFKDNSVKTIYGVITERISSRKFRILDDIDRTLIVESERDWSLGTYVIVQNNLIVGTGRRSGTFKVYKV